MPLTLSVWFPVLILLSISFIGVIRLNEKIIFFNKISIDIFLFLFHTTYVFSKELNFKALEILTYEEGNLIIGKKDAEAIIEGELEIYADKFTYNRKKKY